MKKICTKCKQEKNQTDFGLTKIRGRMLRRSWCASCMQTYYKEYHLAKNRTKPPAVKALPMFARDFINTSLLPWLELEIRSAAKRNKQYIAGFEDAMRAMTQFLEAKRQNWDSSE